MRPIHDYSPVDVPSRLPALTVLLTLKSRLALTFPGSPAQLPVEVEVEGVGGMEKRDASATKVVAYTGYLSAVVASSCFPASLSKTPTGGNIVRSDMK